MKEKKGRGGEKSGEQRHTTSCENTVFGSWKNLNCGLKLLKSVGVNRLHQRTLEREEKKEYEKKKG